MKTKLLICKNITAISIFLLILSPIILFSAPKDSTINIKKVYSAIDSIKNSDFYKAAELEFKKHAPEIKAIIKKNFKKVSKKTLENDKLMRAMFKESYKFCHLASECLLTKLGTSKFAWIIDIY